MISVMKKNHLTLKLFGLIVLTDIGESIAQLFMKTGLTHTGISSITFANLLDFASKCCTSYFIWLGVLVYIINFFLWITVLSRIDLSVAFPVGSTSYIFVPILAMIFLHETINPIRWGGIALIVLGIHYVSQSTKNQTEII